MSGPRTLRKCFNNVGFNAGINQQLKWMLKNHVHKMPHLDKYCSLVLDEMVISPDLMYCWDWDEIVGYVDQGIKGDEQIQIIS